MAVAMVVSLAVVLVLGLWIPGRSTGCCTPRRR